MQLRTSPASRRRSRAPSPGGVALAPETTAPRGDVGPLVSRATARATIVGAVISITLAAMGACSSSAEDLFGDASGTSDSAGAGGNGGAASGSTSATSGSATSTSASGSGSGNGGGAGTGGAGNPTCGDGACNGSETPNTCLKDCPADCGDGSCDGAETSQSCPKDCDPPVCAHAVCETGEKLTMGCDPCVDTVCADDAFCCTDNWDGGCVGKADALCGAGCCGDGACDGEGCDSCPQDCGTCPPPPTCAHSVCTVAGPLNTNDCYDPCVSETCAADASCCQPSPPMWTGECVALAKMTCGPDPCVTAVCAQDPSCCTDTWTQACVDLAKTECEAECSCAHSVCDTGNNNEKLSATCSPCAASICEADPYCCDTNWDGYCVGEVGSICGIICD